MRGVYTALLVALLGVTLLLPGAGGALAAAGIWLACVLVVARSHPNGLMSLACLYLVLLGLFHLGLVVPVTLHPGPGELPEWLASRHLPTALGLFSTAAVAVALGATLVPVPAREEPESHLPAEPQLFRVGRAVAALGAVLLWIGVWQLGLLSSGYDVYFERAMSEDVRFFGFGLMLFPIGLLVAAVGATPRQMAWLAAGFGLVMGPLFLSGFRGPVLVQMISLSAVWAHKDARVARRVSLIAAAAALVLIPVIRMTRNAGEEEKRDLRVGPMAVFEEAGGSIYPLVVTAEGVESGTEPLWLGRSYLFGLKRIVPNVSTRWRAPGGRVLTPSAWATLQADPWTFEHGGGIGFSGIAEPYLNFGKAGVVLFFFAVGFVIRRFDGWLERDPFRAAVGAASFGAVLWTVRNDSIELFRVLAIASLTVLAAWAVARFAAQRARAADQDWRTE
ncbi:O-antigen polysaccharide polymerase Wzy [Anaeromyxobacter paludicola]|uniref:O-antigen polymerase n=1 Tax=Anaeromyxobacter paludicola TaxID=2918171 RepID=A0ABM7X9N0_9BACT|nr:O-antigen polysaccharide polymerase Wzy [Anaeromyxobacter paludicola]BDG08520.1 hypothetical protein AMPC_16330 [Anaeromyxobacter paludicola]